MEVGDIKVSCIASQSVNSVISFTRKECNDLKLIKLKSIDRRKYFYSQEEHNQNIS